MATTMELFDTGPFTRKRPHVRRIQWSRHRALRPEVRAALLQLKKTLDNLPAEEMERRKQTYEAIARNEGGN